MKYSKIIKGIYLFHTSNLAGPSAMSNARTNGISGGDTVNAVFDLVANGMAVGNAHIGQIIIIS